jgi:hypothetical protein
MSESDDTPRSKPDVEALNELAVQLEDLANNQSGRKSLDPTLANLVLTRLSVLRRMERGPEKGNNIRRKIDVALKLRTDESARNQSFLNHIAVIDGAISGTFDKDALRGTAIFLRKIIIGFEQHMIAMDSAQLFRTR